MNDDPDAPENAAIGAFLRAVREGDVGAVRAVLAADPTAVHATGPHPYWGGRPQAIHMAVEGGRPEMLDLILEAGADPNGVNAGYDHWSPLMLAMSEGREAMRRTLLDRGARIGLIEAMMMKDDALTARLLEPGVEALPEGPNRGSLLAFARTPWAIDRLLELGVDATMRDRWGASPIEAMSRLADGGRELVRHMMARGVTAEPQEFARMGDREALEDLAGSDPEILNRDAVMMGAVDFGRRDLVRWLLTQGASPNVRAAAQSRHTALHSAAWNGDLEMVRLLVEAGADVRARDEEHDATPEGWAETAVTVTGNPDCATVAAWLATRAGA